MTSEDPARLLPPPPQSSTHGPLTVTDFVVYQGASGDLAAIHHDLVTAQAAGYDKPFAPGMYPAGLLASWATGWLGPRNIRSFKVRFANMLWPGDVLTCGGELVKAELLGSDVLAEVELEARAQHVVVVKGWATFLVPASGQQGRTRNPA